MDYGTVKLTYSFRKRSTSNTARFTLIAIPMILGQISLGFIVLLVQNVENGKERIAAKQAKLALDIANKTLPYFRNINSESLNKICTIIKEEINADAVLINDTINLVMEFFMYANI